MAQNVGANPSVIVTGDMTVDWNIARVKKIEGSGRDWNPDDCTRACGQRGGAALLGDLIEAAAAALKGQGMGLIEVHKIPDLGRLLCPGDGRFHQSYAQWSLFKFSLKADSEAPAWRVAEFMGVDRGQDGWTALIEKQLQEIGEPGLIVLHDADLGFRSRPNLWGDLLKKRAEKPWILLKMSRPVAQGELWDHLRREWAERLIVVTTVNDLRRTEVQISRELSWERTAQDLAWELIHNPRVNALSACAGVVVSFDTSGAFLLRGRRGTLLFDSKVMEGGWNDNFPGGMIGTNSCLAAGIARELMRSPAGPDIEQAVQSGIFAMRRLRQEGYGDLGRKTNEPCLAFPVDLVVAALGEDRRPCSVAAVQDPADHLNRASVSSEKSPPAGFWTILQDRYAEDLDQVSCRIVLEGAETALGDVPLGKFGGLLTVDRREIESFRGIRSLVAEYCCKNRPGKPLSIAVFGAPGSGKSFGINEVARSLFPDLIRKLEFNITQFSGPEDLHQALHQVRDTNLMGQIPLVFFDEFDTVLDGQSLGWLRHFLMPMQDGAFLHGRMAHPIGAAIFVFAGGTSENLESFGTRLRPEDFSKAKGPDFVSRLKGFVNIMGPNPAGGNIGSDPFYPLRRAILLRSILGRQAKPLFDKRDGQERLQIDPGVLNAFLMIGRYKHGARSMESIIAMSRLAGKTGYERSCLPSESQLDLHVDGLEFLALVQQIVLTPDLIDNLAETAHEIYGETKKAEGFVFGPEKNEAKKTNPWLIPYAQLPEGAKEANRANVRAIPQKLAAAGYIMIPARSNQPAPEFSGAELEKLARLEHEIWMAAKHAAGFEPGHPTPAEPKRNEYLVEWEKLDETVKDIDRGLIKNIPRILARAGYAIEKLHNHHADRP